jgi:hypothetical protein
MSEQQETQTPVPPAPAATTSAPAPREGDVIEARGALYYRLTRILLVVMFVGMGSWFAYDGWVGWPEENRKAEAEPTRYKHHSTTDLVLQKVLGCTLVPAGIALLVWTFYHSRGSYRLIVGRTLSVPGHPHVPLTSIVRLDKRLWDRKGIVWIDYELPGDPLPKMLMLDDFVYEREPTDTIFKSVEDFVLAETAALQRQ